MFFKLGLVILLSHLSFLYSVAVIYNIEANKVVCYHTNWSQYRSGDGKFLPSNIDPNLCTHIIYSFAKVSGSSLQPYEHNDISFGYPEIMKLKQANPKLKIMLAVGGWNHGPGPFSAMVNNQASRNAFVTQSAQYLKQHGFDGLDLDWEYPSSADKSLFSTLCKELKDQYSKQGLLVSAAVAAGKGTIDSAYEVANVANNLDFINLMSYDLHGSWESWLGHNAPLYARSNEVGDQRVLNVKYAAEYWVNKGCPKEKLIIGLGNYGRSFTMAGSSSALGSPAVGAGSAGPFTGEGGFLSYYEVCQKLKQGWKREWNDEQKVPYASSGNQWIGYDDLESMVEKTKFIKSGGYGGAMFWALDLDDFSGKFCDQGSYPLINKVKSVLNNDADNNRAAQADVAATEAATTTVETNANKTGPVTESKNNNSDNNNNNKAESSNDQSTAGAWQQCGGIGYNGPQKCIAGYYCRYGGAWWSMCTPN